MFNSFKRKSTPPDFVYDQALLIDILFSGIDEFGSKEGQEHIQKLEEAIRPVLPENAGIDGHEFGEGTATIYIYGPSADELFKPAEPILKKTDFNRIDITLQYGLSDDPSTVDKKFSL